MTTLLYWVPAWAFIFVQAFIIFEQGVHRDRNRKAETACEDTENATGSVSPHACWPAHDTQGRSRTGPRAVDENLPILAHRLAHVDFTGDGIVWRPLTRRDTFGVEADAVCRVEHLFPDQHLAPTWGCTCGFYAVPADIDLRPAGFYVDLEVMLTGDVIIHEKGYRAAHQTVLAMTVPQCFCGAPSRYVALTRNGMLQGWGCTAAHTFELQGHMMQATTSQALISMRSGGEARDFIDSFFWGIVSVETLAHYCPVPIRNH